MIHKLLVGYDGSESSAQALEFAVELAEKYGASMHVLAVARPPEFGTEVETEAIIEHSRHHFEEVLASAKSTLPSGAIDATFQVLVGHPAAQILLYAEKHGVDHIVVGHRGRSMLERWLIGSVARQVVVHAHCPVTVVRR